MTEAEIADGMIIRIGPYLLKALFSRAATIREIVSVDESTHTESAQPLPNPVFEQRLLRLTPKQTQVFELLLDGLQEKEVATRMGITGNTVHEHVKAIYKVLDVSTRGELIALGHQCRNLPRQKETL